MHLNIESAISELITNFILLIQVLVPHPILQLYFHIPYTEELYTS